jgi:hypothetical protein
MAMAACMLVAQGSSTQTHNEAGTEPPSFPMNDAYAIINEFQAMRAFHRYIFVIRHSPPRLIKSYSVAPQAHHSLATAKDELLGRVDRIPDMTRTRAQMDPDRKWPEWEFFWKLARDGI